MFKWIYSVFETGEYFFSLKKYKIPHKTSDKSAKFDVNNPPPPGTEDEEQLKTDGDSYVSPLAAVKRPTQPKFEISVKPIEKPDDVQISLDSLPKPTKRSALFSKFVNNTKPWFIYSVNFNVYLIKMTVQVLQFAWSVENHDS